MTPVSAVLLAQPTPLPWWARHAQMSSRMTFLLLTTSLVVNSKNVILDDIWAWRAHHGNGVGWANNTADTGVIVNGDNVAAAGLFVHHYQKTEWTWDGNGGTA